MHSGWGSATPGPGRRIARGCLQGIRILWKSFYGTRPIGRKIKKSCVLSFIKATRSERPCIVGLPAIAHYYLFNLFSVCQHGGAGLRPGLRLLYYVPRLCPQHSHSRAADARWQRVVLCRVIGLSVMAPSSDDFYAALSLKKIPRGVQGAGALHFPSLAIPTGVPAVLYSVYLYWRNTGSPMLLWRRRAGRYLTSTWTRLSPLPLNRGRKFWLPSLSQLVSVYSKKVSNSMRGHWTFSRKKYLWNWEELPGIIGRRFPPPLHHSNPSMNLK